ncbi:CLAVATA3/ESR (CLE)-related protein 25 [Hevea brasiliensis]|uniref:CLAVATA3/ESR (CLE)-related protein 25 n=1 Tax=Hevea brasiliensis TaxID=3981 RepID=UPI0025DE64F7|nr:CLAVATA3/ESR (CLE)-related protein 25 [Hevea brasiliensis]
MGSGRRALRALLGAILFVGVIWFLCVGISANHATRMTRRATVVSTGTFEHSILIGRGRHPRHKDLDLNYVIKRRVPNGPDPIHNRRASQSRQPPGRS